MAAHFVRLLLLTCSFSIILTVGCSTKDRGFDGTNEKLDNERPSQVSDLFVFRVASHEIGLRWTATGDDGDSGIAISYELRFSESPIDTANWSSAIIWENVPTPSSPTATDSVVVKSLVEYSTYYFAIKVSDDAGNTSGMSNVASAMCFDDYEVSIPDPAFNASIRFYSGKPQEPILRSDLYKFESLNLRGQGIYDLSGIEHCIRLQSLIIWNNHVTDLSPLSGLIQLRSLDIGYNGIADISALTPLVNLEVFFSRANHVVDLQAMTNMNQLIEVDLTSNEIWNASPLSGKPSIRDLFLEANQIVFTNPLYNLTGLERLKLSHNLVADLLPLAHNTGLSDGDTLWLVDNPLNAATTDSLLTVLQDRGVTVVR